MKMAVLHPAFLVLVFLSCTASAAANETVAQHPLEPGPYATSPQATLKTFMEAFREAYDIFEQQGKRRGFLSTGQRQY